MRASCHERAPVALQPGMHRRAALLVLLAACGPRAAPSSPAPTAPSPLADQAVRGVHDPALRALLADEWETSMRRAPTWATSLGDHRYDDLLSDESAAGIAQAQAETRAFLARARAIDPRGLDHGDAVTLQLATEGLAASDAMTVCRYDEWSVSARGNPLGELSNLAEQHLIPTAADGDHLLARFRAAAAHVDDHTANLARGLAAGRVAPKQSVALTIEQLDRELARPTDAWAMAAPAAAPHPGWSADAQAAFARALRAEIADHVKPALVRYRDLLHDRILPAARTDEGLHSLPDGDACYRAMILTHLGQAHTPQELHELGLREIARTDGEIAALGKTLFGTTDLAATIAHLRTDRSLYFTSKEELLAAATADLERARQAIPRFFGRLPVAACVVKEIPDHEAPFTTIAYYNQPNYDGSKPGEYFVNTYQPETRPRWELATLTAHESIPGHHLQIAIAQELGELPLFRKLDGSTAFVEGWALYTERLADEMGLYASDLDRLGRSSYDAWRASRLVVDTGLHAMGWTRAQAEAYMLAHTALTPENIKNEVDRYISDPGQALAYKVGQLEILRLRAKAEAALGPRFDLRGFHDAVLGGGAVSLTILGQQVDAWIAAVQAAEPPATTR
ncbi:MAG: DUF885 domain-containing protein [Deltaproteobacteria bacterium]|nr:DUF885 domain-containing protein [Deltaproteobacteria bacterium]